VFQHKRLLNFNFDRSGAEMSASTGAEVSYGQFGTGAEVSWCRTVPVPKCP